MNVLAAGHGWRDLAVWAMPPVAYALASDTAIGVVRAWTIARQKALNVALADDEATPLAILGGLLLWLLRLGSRRFPRWPGSAPGWWRSARSPRAAAPSRSPATGSPRDARHAPAMRRLDRSDAAARSGAAARTPAPRRRGSWTWSTEPVRAAGALPARRRVPGQRRAGSRGRPRPWRGPHGAAPPCPCPLQQREHPVTYLPG